MDEQARALLRIELFDPLPPERLEAIAPAVPSKAFEAGEHVFTPAYEGEVFFLLVEGRVRLYRLRTGREVTMGVLEAGELFGEAAFTARDGEGSWAQLASMIGAKRITVSRPMKGLREAGAVESGHRSTIVVRDAEALGRIAEEAV